MKRSFVILLLLVTAIFAKAQSEADALRYSYYMPSGTARVNGMGGSFGALGSDPSMINFNPAGLGVFKTTQILFTPSFKINNSEAAYLGKRNRDFSANYFDLNDLSFVNSIQIDNGSSQLSYFVWGLSYSQLNKFSQNVSIIGINENGSYSDWLAARSNGYYAGNLNIDDPFYGNLAWNTYLIDPTDIEYYDQYVTAYDAYGEEQSQRISRKGTQGEYNIAMAFNFGHRFYLGVDLGIQTVSYKETKITKEVRNNVVSGPRGFEFSDNFYTSGVGANFKIGVLYSPIEQIRFGASLHTPTSLKMTDRYDTYCMTYLGDSTLSEASPEGEFDYTILTPLRATASICYIPSESFLLNFDYEIANYNSIKMRSDLYEFATETENIINNYRIGHSMKLGGEYRIGALNFRLGGAFYTSPYVKNHINDDYFTWLASAGAGYRSNHFFIDFAYSYLANSYTYFMYEGLVTSDPAKIKTNRSQVTCTIGFKW